MQTHITTVLPDGHDQIEIDATVERTLLTVRDRILGEAATVTITDPDDLDSILYHLRAYKDDWVAITGSPLGARVLVGCSRNYLGITQAPDDDEPAMVGARWGDYWALLVEALAQARALLGREFPVQETRGEGQTARQEVWGEIIRLLNEHAKAEFIAEYRATQRPPEMAIETLAAVIASVCEYNGSEAAIIIIALLAITLDNCGWQASRDIAEHWLAQLRDGVDPDDLGWEKTLPAQEKGE
ncbi:hypothetical protein [Aggregatilinea lenta]|uniref:hypothetical protein n=1 Tax=Aggregatilinea lenta TaxID=913108 RepID=UPI000E5C094B|nr:hypothetical protein [Aggregatilinea lenta]